MARLDNDTFIAASPDQVWAALADLALLPRLDPDVATTEVTSDTTTGVGASRRSVMEDGNFFADKVTEWEPGHAVAFELTACSFPVRALNYRYTVEAVDGGTRVRQVQEYRIKWGLFGQLLDALVIRRKWDAGVRSFLGGVKAHVEGAS